MKHSTKKIILGLLFACSALCMCAQQPDAQVSDEYEVLPGQWDGYQSPTEPEVLANLREWQDLKFGLFMHWAPSSQWGIVESWSICPVDVDWIKRPAGTYSGKTVKQTK